MSANRSFIHPDALAALEQAEKNANMHVVIAQTQGIVSASAGTHESAGTYKDKDGRTHSYSACIDFSVNRLAVRLSDGKKLRMDEIHIRWWLEKLSEVGIAAFYRTRSQGFDAAHIHAICAMVKMEPICENQVIDYVSGHNGLRGHGVETFWHASDANNGIIARAFTRSNPEAAKRLPAKYRGAK